MKHFTIRQLIQATNGVFYGKPEALDNEIAFVTSDSREVGAGALFVAFKGARVDGHDFMAQCLQSGATCCLSERMPNAKEEPCVVVDSTLHAMGALATWYREQFNIPVIGITGSVGKTTTKEMIASVLSEGFFTHKTEKNFNNALGVPQTLLKMDKLHQAAVIEMGISDFGEMRVLTNMVKPTIAVMSIIGDSHLEFLGDHAGVLRAKGEIFESMKPDDLAILNGDDEYLKNFTPPTRKLTYGLNPENDFVATNVCNMGADGVRCTISHHGHSFNAYIPAFGVHMVYAALAGTAVGYALGLNDAQIAKGISRFRTVGERARILRTAHITIVSDCYNANPSSVGAAIRSLKMLQGRKVCILGDMLELGENTIALHEGVGKKAAEEGMDLVLTAGELSKHICEGMRSGGGNAKAYETRDDLIADLSNQIHEGDAVLVKASHSMAFEKVTQALLNL